MSSIAHLTIDLAAIRHNLQMLDRHLPTIKVMVILKANGYGTSSTQLIPFLQKEGVQIFGLAHTVEAVHLRKTGVDAPLFVLHATPKDAPIIAQHDLQVGVSSLSFLEALKKTGKPIRIHLHVDTGMSRLGCSLEELPFLAKTAQNSCLIIEGVMSHLATADCPDQQDLTHLQLQRFHSAISLLHSIGIDPPLKHLCNSAGAQCLSPSHCNMVRIGLLLYGISPLKEGSWLTPALTLESFITHIREYPANTPVSYGATFWTKRPTRIGVVPIGYHDGISRHFSNRGTLLIKGQRCPIIGTICMDFLMVDLTDLPQTKEGTPVLFFGKERPIQEFCREGETIPHELLTSLGPRIDRLLRE